MEKIVIISIAVTVLFCIFKIVEMKFIDKELKPLKFMIRDAVFVFASSIIGCFVYFHLDNDIVNFFNVVKDVNVTNPSTTQVFTGDPGF
jgi:hypothetical protein